MPGIRVVAVGTAEQTTGHEQDGPQSGSVVAGRSLIGMDVTEGSVGFVRHLRLVGRVRRLADAQVISAAGLQRSNSRHGHLSLNLSVERSADHVLLLLARESDEVNGVS